MTDIHEQLIDDSKCNMVDTFSLQDGKYVIVAEFHQWRTEQVTDKAALLSFPNGLYGANQ